jgi:hypothetical protein
MKKINQIKQETIFGDNKIIIELTVSMDVGRLKEIVETESIKIQNIFENMAEDYDVDSRYIDDGSISIFDKNDINGLTYFWEGFIKKHESKLQVLKDFFAANDYVQKIEKLSDDLREEIFAFRNKNDNKLTPELLRIIVNQHTKSFADGDDKDIAKLIIFYLYRFCFIGRK